MDNAEKFPIQRFTTEEKTELEALVIKEIPLTIILNNQELVTLLCSASDLKYLAIGFLSSEGFLHSKDEIKQVNVNERAGVVRVETTGDNKETSDRMFKRLITSGCGRGAAFYSAADVETRKVISDTTISVMEVFALSHKFQNHSELYLSTRGAHSSALCDNTKILVSNEDVGRHNAIDKVFGQCLLKDIPSKDRIIITSGRISSEILHKVAKQEIPIIISKSVPTNLGVRLSNDLGITLVGYVRGKKMNVYSNAQRITSNIR